MTKTLLTSAAALCLAASAALASAPSKTEIPVPKLKISTSKADIAKGQEMFAAKGCVACHKVGGGKLVGPDLKGVLTRRDQNWVSRFILRPDVMLAEDPEAKKLLSQYFVPMPNQNVDPKKELPLILAYLKGAK
ncbi:MAG TPA: cytochrome c [Aggregicoccus sp.]|nr:cytochrome c [Aggregicoccus sp.]